ncbi:iron-siderophore ABC transporter substrate-binding protein [Paraburkholderia xenovorans]|uniref:iron-siderophore ABC transporter substrate-binding protein n=1 Tax=Paraburkholderia xenovorans TaxID=36873 RepID=UPI0038BAA45B
MSGVRLPFDVSARRRRLLRALVAGGIGGAGLAGVGSVARATAAPASVPRRIVVLSWDLTEMLLSLGVTPVGIAAPAWYRSGSVEPPLPGGVVDVGLLFQPNYDLLFELRPDLFIVTPDHASVRAQFERIAPTLTLGRYTTQPRYYETLCGEVLTLGARLGVSAAAQSLIAATTQKIAQARASLDASAPASGYREVYVAQAVDDRHLRVFGAGSMFDEMLLRLGIRNAGSAITANRYGFALVELERVAAAPDAQILWVGGISPEASAGLASSRVWQALPFSTPGRTADLPTISPTGASISVQRFVSAVARVMPATRAT